MDDYFFIIHKWNYITQQGITRKYRINIISYKEETYKFYLWNRRHVATDDIRTIGERLEDVLKERHITQAQLSRISDVNASLISDMVQGRKRVFRCDSIIAICKSLHITTDWLLGLPGAVKKPDTNLRAVCEYTGLDEEAVNHLHTWKTEKKTEILPDGTIVLNGDHSPCFKALEILINLPEGNRLLYDLIDYIQAKRNTIYTMQPGQKAIVEGYAFFQTGESSYDPLRADDIEKLLRMRLLDDVQRMKERIQSDGLEG